MSGLYKLGISSESLTDKQGDAFGYPEEYRQLSKSTERPISYGSTNCYAVK